MPEPEASLHIDLTDEGTYQIKTADLERLRQGGHGELADRIYAKGEDEGLGHYDHLVNDSDELRTLVRFLPLPILRELSHGAWPEPHCGVCRALEDKRYLRNRIVCVVLDWHDTPFREMSSRYRAGKKVYERCLKVYELAEEAFRFRLTPEGAEQYG
jgi:hypothetical protein